MYLQGFVRVLPTLVGASLRTRDWRQPRSRAPRSVTRAGPSRHIVAWAAHRDAARIRGEPVAGPGIRAGSQPGLNFRFTSTSGNSADGSKYEPSSPAAATLPAIT